MSLTTAPPEVSPHASAQDPAGAAGVRQAAAAATRAAPLALNLPLMLALAGALIYFVAAVRIATIKEPFIDEGWFANPAYNLAFHGYMGSNALDPNGTWLTGELKGVQQHAYFMMPLDIVVQAGWYRVAGFGLLQMRLLSILWGALALAAWYFIVERLTRNPLAGALAVFLLSCDFTFLWSGADGRMDMMCVALGSAALAVYLTFRENRFGAALFAANALAAASVFTHPNGVVWVALLATLVLLHNRRCLRPRHALALLPYFAFLTAWAWYIAKSPADFRAQFSSNLHPPSGTRGFGLLHPWWSLRLEWSRYFAHFGDALWAAPVPRWAIVIPFLLWAVCIAASVRWLRTRDRALGVALLLLSLCLAFMTFADSLKAENYLGMAMPLYAAVAAIWAAGAFSRDAGAPRLSAPTFAAAWLPCSLLGVLLLFQLAVLGRKLGPDPLHDEFEPTAAFLKTLGNVPVTADSVFGFELGWDRLTDDARLGFHSGRKPEVIVADRWYVFDWQIVFSNFDRPAWQYIHDLFARDYHPVFVRGRYVVLLRNDLTIAPPRVPPAAAAH